MKNAQLKKMLLKLSESPNLLYKIEQIKLPDSQSGWYGVMTYSKKIYEVYAKGIGLVKKYWKDLTISNFDTLNVQFGVEQFYTISGYGFQ